MKNILQIIAIAAITIVSCTPSKYATTTSTYESDDVYYQPSDTYISDFALVDDEARMQDPNSVSSDQVDPVTKSEDDYFSGDTASTNNGTINNYYGDVYQSPWSNNYGGNCGYGAYNYGSYSYFPSPRFSVGYSPWTGWYSSFNFGYNWGYSPYYSPYYGSGFGWYSPYYNPWYYNQWGYNTWYTPYNYYNPYYGYNNPYYGGYWNGNYWYDDEQYSNVIFGHRNPIATGSIDNSTYGDDIFYSGRVSKPTDGSQPSLANSQPQVAPATLNNGQTTTENHAEKPTLQNQNNNQVATTPGNRPTVSQANESIQAEKPNANSSDNHSVFKPQTTPASARPTYSTESVKPSMVEQGRPAVNNNQPDYYEGNHQKPNTSSPSNSQPVFRNPAPVIPSQHNTVPDTRPARNESPNVRPEPQRQNPQARPEQKPVSPSRNNMPSGGGDKGGRVSPPQSPPSGGHKSGGTPSGGGQHNSGGSVSGPRRK